MLDDLQKDSDEEVVENTDVELPFQEQWHFEKFKNKYRKAESKEEVKTALDSLEKDALLLNLILIAFNKALEGNIQTHSLLIETPHSMNIIWDFVLISFRFYGEPEGFSCYFGEFKRLDKFLLNILLYH